MGSTSSSIPCNIVETSKTVVKTSFVIPETLAFDRGDKVLLEFEMFEEEQLLPRTIKFLGTTGHRDKIFTDLVVDCAPANEKIINNLKNSRTKQRLIKQTSSRELVPKTKSLPIN